MFQPKNNVELSMACQSFQISMVFITKGRQFSSRLPAKGDNKILVSIQNILSTSILYIRFLHIQIQHKLFQEL